jgi:membrane fusion protein (multidrug efflux system)
MGSARGSAPRSASGSAADPGTAGPRSTGPSPTEPDAQRAAAGTPGPDARETGPAERSAQAEAGQRPRPRRGLLALLVAVIALAAAVRYGPRLLYLLEHENTDDAYVHGGTIVSIEPQVQGKVVELHVDDNQDVRKGDLLVVIDPRDYQAAVARAEAAVAQEQAQLENARQLLHRSQPLERRRVLAPEKLDEIEAQSRVAEAGLAAARAQLEQAQIDLARTRIVAPFDGRVTQRNVSVGSVVARGDALFALVDLHDVWVMANFKETQIGSMRVGQPADLEVDAYPGRVFHGHVASFQAATGSVTSLLPPENATGQFVKVVQRLPVRIDLDPRSDAEPPLYPGLSVVVHVDTRGSTSRRAADGP